jgi:hypothetical protein
MAAARWPAYFVANDTTLSSGPNYTTSGNVTFRPAIGSRRRRLQALGL